MSVLKTRLESEKNHFITAQRDGILDSLGLEVKQEFFGDWLFDKVLHADLLVRYDNYLALAAIRVRKQADRHYGQYTQTGLEADGKRGEAVTGHAKLLIYMWCSACSAGSSCDSPEITEAHLADLEKMRGFLPDSRMLGGGHDKRQELWGWDISRLLRSPAKTEELTISEWRRSEPEGDLRRVRQPGEMLPA